MKPMKFIIALTAAVLPAMLSAQAGKTLNADGRTDTYKLIESFGYGVEVPDCGHPVKHITQQFDEELGKHVFAFTLHALLDDDRCGAQDRQRTEIKTFGPSPESMKGFRGQTVTYRWKFRLDEGFQPSPYFCHIHQIKADSGPEAGAPVVTLTPRLKASGSEVLQFMIVTAENKSTIVAEVDLIDFKGTWVEVEETMLHDSDGTIEMTIRRVSDGKVLLHGAYDGFDFWREGARFNRPKYGIYRSLREREYLRDESVLFADIEYETVADRHPELRADVVGWDYFPQLEGKITEPVFAARLLNVVDFGARGDNLKDNTASFNSAIEACSSAGGGQVFVPGGIYRIESPVRLLSGVLLNLEDGVVLLLSGDEAGITAVNADNIEITGWGLIEGEGTIRFSNCETIMIASSGISVDLTFDGCRNVSVNYIYADAPLTIRDCRDVLVWYCRFSSDSDNLLLCADDVCEGIIIQDNYFSRAGESALVLGRNSVGSVRNVFATGNRFGNIPDYLVWFNPDTDKAPTVEDVWIRDSHSEGYPCRSAVRVDQPSANPTNRNAAVPKLWYAYFDNFTGINATENGISINSLPRTLQPVESMWFSNMQITGTPVMLDKNGGRDIYTDYLVSHPIDLPGRNHIYPSVRGAALGYTPGEAPDFWSVAAARTVMAKWPDYTQAYFNAWTYVNGYMACSLERLYKATGDETYLGYIKTYIDNFIDAEGNFVPVTNNKGLSPMPAYCDNLDGMMTGNTLVMLYEYYGEERYRIAADKILACMKGYPRNNNGGFWHGVRLDGQMWIDGIFMGQMFLLRYGRSIGESAYAWDEAARQILSYAESGQKGDTGLYVHGVYEPGHGPRPCLWADPATGQSSEVWGEGLGWYALVLVEALESMPRKHKDYKAVRDVFMHLAEALKRTQDPLSGGWYQVVDKGHLPDNWIETSGTAMFTYAIRQGINLGILKEKDYGRVAADGYRSIVNHAVVNERGLVDIYDACDGLGVQTDYDKYIYSNRRAVNAKEAVVGFVWATEIMERDSIIKRRK